MPKKTIYINACNIHGGGGKTLLDGFISGINNTRTHYIIYIDKRYQKPKKISSNIKFIIINFFWKRLFISSYISKTIKKNDIVLYMGNLPPFFKIKYNKCILILSNRFYVDNKVNMSRASLKIKLKIFLEKIYFKNFIKNISEIIVQTTNMKKLCMMNKINKKITIAAFDDYLSENEKTISKMKEKNSFIYVASTLPYKNHLNLIKSIKIINDLKLEYKLYLTIDDDTVLSKEILNYISRYNLNIVILKNLNRQELIKKYRTIEALIYPSTFEAYGLPLIEAKRYNLKILSSDLDYVWDIVKPDYLFNPYDYKSIARAILRYKKYEKKIDPIYTPKEFVNLIEKK